MVDRLIVIRLSWFSWESIFYPYCWFVVDCSGNYHIYGYQSSNNSKHHINEALSVSIRGFLKKEMNLLALNNNIFVNIKVLPLRISTFKKLDQSHQNTKHQNYAVAVCITINVFHFKLVLALSHVFIVKSQNIHIFHMRSVFLLKKQLLDDYEELLSTVQFFKLRIIIHCMASLGSIHKPRRPNPILPGPLSNHLMC